MAKVADSAKNMMFRLAQQADLARVIQLQEQGGFSDWSAGHFQTAITKQQCLLLESQECVVGFIVMDVIFEQAELLNMVVDATQQRKGYARSLYLEAAKRAKEKGASECLLEVAKSNVAARSLYESLGFGPIGERKNYYQLSNGLKDDAVVMKASY